MSIRERAAATLLSASVLLPRPVPAAEKPLSPAQRQEIVQTITRLEEKWIRVWATRDVSVLEDLLAEDFVATTSTGAVRSKPEHIAGYREDLKTYYAVENDEMIPHVSTGTMAVFTGRDTTHSRSPQGAEVVEHYRWTDTWLLRNGVWQCVATHETQVP
jgi:ketosteroid isomerase-like protein